MSEKREQRFCPCGYSVFGSDLERRNAFVAHRESGDHQKRLNESASDIDGLVEADIERSASGEGE